MTRIKIKGPRVLIQRKELDEVSEGGIILARGSKHAEQLEKHKEMVGKIIQVGDMAFYDKTSKWCEVGDWVYFHQYSGKIILDPDDEKTEYVVLNDEDIIATIEGGIDE